MRKIDQGFSNFPFILNLDLNLFNILISVDFTRNVFKPEVYNHY